MLFNNFAALLVKTLPLVIAIFAPKVLNPETGEMEAQYNTPDAAGAWFITMSILLLLDWFVISKYELSDEKMDEINNAIALRNKQ